MSAKQKIVHGRGLSNINQSPRTESARTMSFGMISDSRSLELWCIKEIGESTLVKNPSVFLMHYDLSDDLSDLGSLIPFGIVKKPA